MNATARHGTVSVVVPTHNRVQLLAQTLRAILGQRDVDTEIVVVNDSSTDETDALLQAQAPRVRCLAITAGSASAARNAGIAATTGNYIAFCDDDDLWAPTKLRAQLDAMERGDAGWSTTDAVVFAGAGHLLAHYALDATPPLREQLRRSNALPGSASSVLVRRDVLQRVGGFEPTLRNSEDWDMWLRIAAVARHVQVPLPLVALRRSEDSSYLANDPRVALAALRRRHPDLAVDTGDDQMLLAYGRLRAGRSSSAALHFLHAAAAHRQPRRVALAAATLVSGRRVLARSEAADRARIPADVQREVAAWLGPALAPTALVDTA